ncbi:MAG: nucleotidyltransferase family protein [Patescibacteria group bacterium]
MKKDEIQKRLREVLRTSPLRRHVRRVSLFGSHLHGTANEKSDVDLLIEFGTPISIFSLVRMEREMSKALGRDVDLCTPKSLSKYFRSVVVQEAEPLFESVA